MNSPKAQARYPGIPSVGDGNAAVVAMEALREQEMNVQAVQDRLDDNG